MPLSNALNLLVFPIFLFKLHMRWGDLTVRCELVIIGPRIWIRFWAALQWKGHLLCDAVLVVEKYLLSWWEVPGSRYALCIPNGVYDQDHLAAGSCGFCLNSLWGYRSLPIVFMVKLHREGQSWCRRGEVLPISRWLDLSSWNNGNLHW